MKKFTWFWGRRLYGYRMWGAQWERGRRAWFLGVSWYEPSPGTIVFTWTGTPDAKD